MAKRKSVSFETAVKLFIHQYKIPTKRDVDRLESRLDRLEKLILSIVPRSRKVLPEDAARLPQTATDTVFELVKSEPGGIGIADIRERTGYDDKKLRNIIFRLNKMQRIRRVRRGHYTAVEG